MRCLDYVDVVYAGAFVGDYVIFASDELDFEDWFAAYDDSLDGVALYSASDDLVEVFVCFGCG